MVKDRIDLNIPAKPDYISLVRLTTSGIGHNMNFNIEEIEDIKVCVGEACVNVINLSDINEISIIYIVKEDKLTIKVNDMTKNIDDKLNNSQEAELGLLIIKSLMDEVGFTKDGIEMTKYIE
ncbi:MAG TPA: ATP-binding protein [Tissierellaceae bacterium]|nr:ATP-binding protein [Tissierellaceae bacterium]